MAQLPAKGIDISEFNGDVDLEALSADLVAVAEDALRAHTAMRLIEGERLAADILGRLDTIEAITARVEARSPQTVAEYRANILTIHQSIPVNGIASLTLSVDVLPQTGDISEMTGVIEETPGIHYVKILARE